MNYFCDFIWVHNNEPNFYQEIYQKNMNFQNTSVRFCGDWNVVQNYAIDNYNMCYNRNLNSQKND